MPQQDLVECDHVRRRFKGTAFYAYFNPDHKWYYLGNQTPDEVMFLKIFDSDPSVKATSTVLPSLFKTCAYTANVNQKPNWLTSRYLQGARIPHFVTPKVPRNAFQGRALKFELCCSIILRGWIPQRLRMEWEKWFRLPWRSSHDGGRWDSALTITSGKIDIEHWLYLLWSREF